MIFPGCCEFCPTASPIATLAVRRRVCHAPPEAGDRIRGAVLSGNHPRPPPLSSNIGLQFGLWRSKFVVVHNYPAFSGPRALAGLVGRFLRGGGRRISSTIPGISSIGAAGRHLFVMPAGILTFSPLTFPRTHFPSWISITRGVETVGNVEHEPFAGPVRDNLITATVASRCSAELSSTHLKEFDSVINEQGCGRRLLRGHLLPTTGDFGETP